MGSSSNTPGKEMDVGAPGLSSLAAGWGMMTVHSGPPASGFCCEQK